MLESWALAFLVQGYTQTPAPPGPHKQVRLRAQAASSVPCTHTYLCGEAEQLLRKT